jgi:type I restriction enzyme S subunit
MLRLGDVLMTEGGDLDKLGRGTVWNAEIENCLHQNHVFAVRPDQSKLMPEYLALITRTSYARAYFESTGTKTTNLASTSSSKIRDFRVPLISLTDQACIVRETNAWLEEIAKVQAGLTQQRILLAERRQALITAAVTGGITV